MELFAFKAKFDQFNNVVKDDDPSGIYPNANFNTFLDSFLTVFVVLTGDTWTDIYYKHYRAVDALSSSFFFLTLIVVGQYILLMLFLAILVDNFDERTFNLDGT
jgi:hypothetical protein